MTAPNPHASGALDAAAKHVAQTRSRPHNWRALREAAPCAGKARNGRKPGRVSTFRYAARVRRRIAHAPAARGIRHHNFARRRLTGQRDLRDAWMRGQHLANPRIALNNVKDAARHAGFGKNFGELRGPSGVSSAGLNTIVLPQASPGPDFHMAIWMG